MTNGLFQQILTKTPNLQVLRMKNCQRLTRAATKQVGKLKSCGHPLRICSIELKIFVLALKLPSLRALDIRGFNTEELDHIDLGKTKLSALRELRLTKFLGPLRESIIPQNITTLVLSTRMLNEGVLSYVRQIFRIFFRNRNYAFRALINCLYRYVNVRRLEYVPVDWKVDLTGCFPHLESLKVGAVENLIIGYRPK
jgi:hypothetical protein